MHTPLFFCVYTPNSPLATLCGSFLLVAASPPLYEASLDCKAQFWVRSWKYVRTREWNQLKGANYSYHVLRILLGSVYDWWLKGFVSLRLRSGGSAFCAFPFWRSKSSDMLAGVCLAWIVGLISETLWFRSAVILGSVRYLIFGQGSSSNIYVGLISTFTSIHFSHFTTLSSPLDTISHLKSYHAWHNGPNLHRPVGFLFCGHFACILLPHQTR